MITTIAAGMAQASMVVGKPTTPKTFVGISEEQRDDLAKMMGLGLVGLWRRAYGPNGADWREGDYTVGINPDAAGNVVTICHGTVHLGQAEAVAWSCTCKDHQKRGTRRPCGHWLSRVAIELVDHRTSTEEETTP